MRKVLLCLLIGFVVIGCKKKSTIHITAKNAVTGKPYPGLKYAIVRSKTGAFENHYKTVASGKLDENGEAYITKRFSKNWSHSITLQRPANYCYANKLHYYFSGGENVEANFEYAECGYMKFRYHNISCYDQNDLIEVYRHSEIEQYDGFKNPAVYHGCEDYTMNHFVAVPMGKWYFKWEVTKDSTTQVYYDTIFLSSGEQKYYEFNY